MTVLQVVSAPPPLPPMADPNYLAGMIQETFVIVLVLVAVTVVMVKVFGPIARAWANKLEGKVGDSALRGDVEQLREQLAEVEPLRQRMFELEERLEFTERLLTQRRDQDALPRGGPGR
jgi:Tfp pilus assembly protein PilO